MHSVSRVVGGVARCYGTRVVTRAPCARAAVRAMSTVAPLTKPTEEVGAGRPALLFTPGPLTTSQAVKNAMTVDMGTRDARFMEVIKQCRNGILEVANVSQDAGYECVIVQGSGTSAVEATIGTAVPREGAKLLVVNNGAYGARMLAMAKVLGIPNAEVTFGEQEPATVDGVMAAVKADPDITHVAMVHHETTAGALSPVGEVGQALRAHNADITFIVDSMSAFGAYPVDLDAWNIHYLVSSANKCIEGVPGFAFTIANRDKLVAAEGNARSWSFDLVGQWKSLESLGQFRFTPPVQSIMAFRQALREYWAEGGQAARLARYQANFDVLKAGMAEMGFTPYVEDSAHGCIITTFLFPDDPKFDLPTMYTNLANRGLVIYPGKVTKADCFRVGSIGRLFPSDMKMLVLAIRDELTSMGVKLPVTQIKA